jgi:hypothetical protein
MSSKWSSGFYATTSLGTSAVNLPITQWTVRVTSGLVTYMNSGSGTDTVRDTTFRDCQVNLDLDLDLNNLPSDISGSSIVQPSYTGGATSGILFAGALLGLTQCWLRTTVKGTPSGPPDWTFTSLVVEEFTNQASVNGKLTGTLVCRGAGINNATGTINSGGMMTVTPP